MRSSRLVPSVVCLLVLAVPAHAAKPGSSPTDLSGVTQNWDTKLPNDSRFTILPDFNNQAVRDNETGLVWKRFPQQAKHHGMTRFVSVGSVRSEGAWAGTFLRLKNYLRS